MEATTALVWRAFAAAIFAKVGAIQKLAPPHRQRVMESISDDIKKVSNFCKHEVSVAAATAAKALDIDLRQMTWHDQSRFDSEREVFHVEHMVPVSAIRAACLNAVTEDEVLAALKGMRVVWILKSEDDELTRLGFRSRRPDPDAAYREAKIVLLRG